MVQKYSMDGLRRKKWGFIATAIIVIFIVLIGYGNKFFSASRLIRQLELGQKYLEEMKYEEAVVVFNNVITIDPMNADAYLGLVEVYICTGDFDMAIEYAEKGYEVTGDERLKEKMDMIKSGNITASNGNAMKYSYYDGSGILEGYEECTYDLQGKVETISVYNKNGDLVDTGVFQYDQSGNKTINYYYHAPILRLDREEYEYDASGNMISQKIYENKTGKLIDHIEYEYDSEGRKKGKPIMMSVIIFRVMMNLNIIRKGKLLN